MVKKLILAGMLAGSLFANGVAVGVFKSKGNGSNAFMGDNIDKKVFIINRYTTTNATNLDDESLSKVKNQLKYFICSNPQARTLLEKGYEYIITGIYANDVVVSVVINSCR